MALLAKFDVGGAVSGETLDVRLYGERSDVDEHPSTFVDVDEGFLILGGGAAAAFHEAPGYQPLLTAMYPGANDSSVMGTRWYAAAKDHEQVSPSTVTAYCFAARLKPSQVSYPNTTSPKAHHPRATAKLKNAGEQDPFVLTGGGAHAQWTGFGSLLWASRPEGDDSWFAGAKDHIREDQAMLTAYAIGVRRSVLDHFKLSTFRVNASQAYFTDNENGVVVTIEQPDACVISGGADSGWVEDTGTNPGRLLGNSEPFGRGGRGWQAYGTHVVEDDFGSTSVWAIALVRAPMPPDLIFPVDPDRT